MQASAAPTYDAIIIGGGPAGLSAALLLGRACRRVVVVDAGEPRNAAARELHGFLTRDGIAPQELLRLARRDAAHYGVELLSDRVTATECQVFAGDAAGQGKFFVMCGSGKTLTGRKLLFASGTCDKLPDLPGIHECYGATVHHCPYCDGWEHRGKRLLGYGEKAAEAIGLALSLKTWSPQVTALTNGSRATDRERQLCQANQVTLRTERITRLLHASDRLEGVEFVDARALNADALFFNTGQNARCELARSLGCQLGKESRARTTNKQQTNVPGVFLAGDADGDVQFAIVAAAEGATAAVAMNRELQEEDREQTRHVVEAASDSSFA